MNKKIELYTCEYGVALFKAGVTFGAWLENTESFNDTEKEVDGKNIKILVDESDVDWSNNQIGECDVKSLKSVEIIG